MSTLNRQIQVFGGLTEQSMEQKNMADIDQYCGNEMKHVHVTSAMSHLLMSFITFSLLSFFSNS